MVVGLLSRCTFPTPLIKNKPVAHPLCGGFLPVTIHYCILFSHELCFQNRYQINVISDSRPLYRNKKRTEYGILHHTKTLPNHYRHRQGTHFITVREIPKNKDVKICETNPIHWTSNRNNRLHGIFTQNQAIYSVFYANKCRFMQSTLNFNRGAGLVPALDYCATDAFQTWATARIARTITYRNFRGKSETKPFMNETSKRHCEEERDPRAGGGRVTTWQSIKTIVRLSYI